MYLRLYVMLVFGLMGAMQLSAQSIFDVYRDSSEVEAITPTKEEKPVFDENFSNPFEVSHIPVRKNQTQKVKPREGTAGEMEQHINSMLPLLLLLMSSFLLGLLLFFNRAIAADLLQSVSNLNYMQSFRAKMLGIHRPYLFGLYFIFFINASLFVYLVNGVFKSQSLVIWPLLLAFPMIYSLRHLFLQLFGWIFEIESEMGTFSFVIAILNISLGILLLPINFFLAFVPSPLSKIMVGIGIILILLSLAIRYIRGLMIGRSYIIGNSLQFFLYFCTFEIAPILIILYWVGFYG